MEPWEQALAGFLRPWRRRRELVGALVCGSYVTGDPSPRSDVDVHLVLADGTPWRERGNRIVDGVMIEYFANPPGQIRRYFGEDHRDNSAMAPTQFATGRIVFDDAAGVVRQLQSEARAWLRRRFPRPTGPGRAMARYGRWDSLDNLRDAFERGGPGFAFACHDLLYRLYVGYARELGEPVVPAHKLHAYLTSAAARRKYLQRPFADAAFARRLARAVTRPDPASLFRRTERLYEYVIARTGGFEIDGWTLRSATEP